MPKIIFVTGGVISSLGKGISAASLGTLLEARGFKVHLRKFEPYINIDPGTMSPYQHGEVYVTEDGAETDLDLGHYERFTQITTSASDAISTGKIYSTILTKERRGDFLGSTVQVIPHVTDEIKKFVFNDLAEDLDFLICEIGGTVGDIESLPFIEAIRQIAIDLGRANVLFVHLTLLPFIKSAQELKTKPTQHSVKTLQSLGVQPDILLCRSEIKISEIIMQKLALFCNVSLNRIIAAYDAKSLYEIPLLLHFNGYDQQVCNYFNIQNKQIINLNSWHKIVKQINESKNKINIAVIGKYTQLQDAYKSIIEALNHACIANKLILNINFIEAESVTDLTTAKEILQMANGILIPGGYGERGIKGKIVAIQFARTNNIPFLGICLGMQLAVVEFAQNVLNVSNGHSIEFYQDCKQIIELIQKQDKKAIKEDKGGTMRLGTKECIVIDNTLISTIYQKKSIIYERHRHRYTINTKYLQQLSENGMCASAFSKDSKIIEAIELTKHPWFVGVQFHPEFKSKPMKCHPLFNSFIQASLKQEKRG